MLHYGIKELKQVTSCGIKEGEKYLREIPNLFINNSTCVKLLFCLKGGGDRVCTVYVVEFKL